MLTQTNSAENDPKLRIISKKRNRKDILKNKVEGKQPLKSWGLLGFSKIKTSLRPKKA